MKYSHINSKLNQAPQTTRYKKTYKIIRKQSEPRLGSLEQDWIIEAKGEFNRFLDSPKKPEVKFNAKGQIVPWSVVGPAGVFDKLHKQSLKRSFQARPLGRFSLREIPRPFIQRALTDRENQLKKQQTINMYNKRLEDLQKAQELNTSRSEAELRHKRISERIRLRKEENALSNFEQKEYQWQSFEKFLSSRLGRPKSSLAMNRGELFQGKKEGKFQLSKVLQTFDTSSHKAYGKLTPDAYFRNEYKNYRIMNDLYMPIRPDSVMRENMTPERERKDDSVTLLKVTGEHIVVEGRGKLQMEIEAAEQLGTDRYNPKLIHTGPSDESIIAIGQYNHTQYTRSFQNIISNEAQIPSKKAAKTIKLLQTLKHIQY